jgi:hypothetical protein
MEGRIARKEEFVLEGRVFWLGGSVDGAGGFGSDGTVSGGRRNGRFWAGWKGFWKLCPCRKEGPRCWERDCGLSARKERERIFTDLEALQKGRRTPSGILSSLQLRPHVFAQFSVLYRTTSTHASLHTPFLNTYNRFFQNGFHPRHF